MSVEIHVKECEVADHIDPPEDFAEFDSVGAPGQHDVLEMQVAVALA